MAPTEAAADEGAASAPTHSVAVCNYNMADTLERSLRSMIDQVDDRFEVVVVDGGSTDGSRAILRSLENEYDRLRIVLDRADENDWLGGDRNVSFDAARGEYVLESLDTDDRYFDGVIHDFVSIYHTLEPAVGGDFFLSVPGMNMATRGLLLDEPYHDLGGAEDRDLWRRLFDRDALIPLEHFGPLSESIGYDFGLRGRLRRDLHGKICDFQCGITLGSCLRWALHHEHHDILERRRPLPLELLKRLYDLVSFPYAYLRALPLQSYETPPQFRRKGALERRIASERRTLPELEREYDVTFDPGEFSDPGRQAFFPD